MDFDEKKRFVIQKWRDVKYRGAFSGITTLTKLLNEDFDTKFTKNDVINALKTQPAFVNSLRVKTFTRRSYDVPKSFDTWTMDLAFMPKYKHFVGFLLVVDIGSRRIYTRAITNKKASTIQKNLDSIIKEECSGFTPSSIISDGGKEFEGMSVYFKNNEIGHKINKTIIKASIAEKSIGIVKERLHKAMDNLENPNWPSLLSDIVAGINSKENKAVKVRPIDIKTPFDDPLLDETYSQRPYQQPHWFEQIENQKKYEQDHSKIQVGDLVLSHTGKQYRFRKGYQRQVSEHRNKRVLELFQLLMSSNVNAKFILIFDHKES